MAKKIPFTKDQIKRMANILDNAGQVSLATIALPYLLGDDINVKVSVWGTIISLILWWVALRLERTSS